MQEPSRLEILAQRMTCDAAIVTSQVNRFYLTGFSSSAGTLVITREGACFLADPRYIQAAREQVTCCPVMPEQDAVRQIRTILASHHCETVGMETHHAPIAQGRMMEEIVKPARLLWNSEFSDTLLAMRSIKSSGELACLQRAQEITDAAFGEWLNHVRPGVNELDMMHLLGWEMAKRGCEKRSFSMIFTSGERTALPHGDPSVRNVEAGDLVMVDMGAMVGGYSADMTRTIAVGYVSDEKRAVYETVRAAQRLALDAIRPGIACKEVDGIARRHIDASVYAGRFGHNLGHSLGLEIHENPRFSPTSDVCLQPGMVMTVEPGIYLPHRFGVRIEDMVVVTAEGCRNMTRSSKDLIVVK